MNRKINISISLFQCKLLPIVFILMTGFCSFGQAIDSLNKIAPSVSTTDSVKSFKRAEKLAANFDTLELMIQEGELFSKNLRVINNLENGMSFRVDVGYPAEWKSLVNTKKDYFIAGKDTMYVPVRLIPLGKVHGNTKYMITAHLFDTIGAPITSAYVNASKPKLTNWSLNVGPYKKIYFKNDSNETKFTITVGNEGTEPQDIYLSMANIRKDISIMDSTGRYIKNPHTSFTVPQFGDTTFKYKVQIQYTGRNMKRMDTEGYRLGILNESKTYSLFVKTTETSLLGKNARAIAQKLDFVKLPNQQKISKYGMYSLPLIMDFNMSNIMSLQPVAYLYLTGATTLDNGAIVTYNSQFVGSLGILGSSRFARPFFVLGYTTNKLSVNVGDVGGSGAGIGVGGKGANGSYKINRNQRIGGFVVAKPLFQKISQFGFGLNYQYSFGKFHGTASYAHVQSQYNASKFVRNNIGVLLSYAFANKQSVHVGGTLARSTFTGLVKFGYSLNAGYSGSFIHSRLNTSLTGSFISNTYTFFNYGERYNFYHNTNYRNRGKWAFQLMNTYIQYNINQFYTLPVIGTQKTYSNSITASTSLSAHSNIGTSLFYNINQGIDPFYKYTTHSRGVSFNYNFVNTPENLLFGFTSQLGYNRLVSVPGSNEKFFINLFSLVKYRVYSLNVRFSNGLANGGYNRLGFGELYTETFSASFNHQYQFRNKHFILNDAITYNLLPQTDRHSLGLTPEMNYYSKDGWRFRVTAGYYYTSSRPNQYNPYKNFVSGKTEDEYKRIISRSYLLMIGIRKEFGIPLPFIKRRYPTLNFVAFADVNGNGKFDNDETRLENVVINVNGWEVMTDEKGEAQLKNMPEGEYVWQVFSLNDVEDYFPNVTEKITVHASDSMRRKINSEFKTIPVPFVKGVKLYGKIYLDREKFSPDALNQIDLAGIRVNAVNGHKTATLTDKNGEFMFYLPYGDYVVSMDERVLGDRLRLLQNDLEVKLEKGISSLYISFYLAENQRRLNKKRFDANGNLINEGDGNGNANANAQNAADKLADANKNATKNRGSMGDLIRDMLLENMQDATQTTGLIYTVQLGAFQKNASLTMFKELTSLMFEKIDPNFVRIMAGQYTSEEFANVMIIKAAGIGFRTAFVTAYINGKNISLPEAAQIKKNKK